MGVIVAILSVSMSEQLKTINLEEHFFKPAMGETGFMLLGVAFFAFMCWTLWRVARKP
jgi:hypothetical protein